MLAGTPVFHEGQKGYRCCKPRVLTFDEFLTITPCTTGKHTTVDDTPAPTDAGKQTDEDVEAKIKAAAPQPKADTESLGPAIARQPMVARPTATPSPAPPEEEESDPEDAVPQEGASCKRRGCGQSYKGGDRKEEECVYHPGQALFHEGSKGWTCCKRRVLEFDEFMRIPGCKTKKRHLFVGKPKANGTDEEVVKEVRNDFYQTATTVIASLYLKKIDKAVSKVEFKDAQTVVLDLHTADKKRYQTDMPLFGTIDTEKSSFKIMGTKLELTLAKADGSGWPVLRADDRLTGEIIQAGRAGRV